MNSSFSKHAIERINTRGISKKTVLFTIENPDAVLKDSDCTRIYQKVLGEKETRYLYRVFINICKQPPLIITAYKTSKIDKYEY